MTTVDVSVRLTSGDSFGRKLTEADLERLMAAVDAGERFKFPPIDRQDTGHSHQGVVTDTSTKLIIWTSAIASLEVTTSTTRRID